MGQKSLSWDLFNISPLGGVPLYIGASTLGFLKLKSYAKDPEILGFLDSRAWFKKLAKSAIWT